MGYVYYVFCIVGWCWAPIVLLIPRHLLLSKRGSGVTLVGWSMATIGLALVAWACAMFLNDSGHPAPTLILGCAGYLGAWFCIKRPTNSADALDSLKDA